MNSLKQFGFSLVEVMVAMGMLGAGALAYMQINKTNIQANKKTEIRYDVDNLAKEISNVLMSEGACSQTFSGKSFSANGTFSSVRDDRGQIVYRTGEVIPNSVNIVSFNYEVIRTPVAGSQVGEFRISFSYREGNKALNNSNIYEKKINNILFKVVIDSNPAVGMRCFADSEANITANVRSACNAVGGNFDENTFLCALPSKSFGNKKITDLEDEGKDEGLSFQQIEQQILPNLLDPNFLEKEGDTAEEKLTIQGKLLLTGDPSSAKDAVTLGYIDNLLSCPAGKVGVFVASAGKVVCSDLLCSKPGDSAATQAYFVGIDKNGNASCNLLVKSGEDSCASGGALKVDGNGSVFFDCCEATCSGQGDVCKGVQFPSTNNCGFCAGTKEPTNDKWSNWTDAVPAKLKEDGVCVAGKIKMLKLQVRTCNKGNGCGVNECIGDDEKWVDAGTVNCPDEPTSGKVCAWKAGDPAPVHKEGDICVTVGFCHLLRNYAVECLYGGGHNIVSRGGSCESEDGGNGGSKCDAYNCEVSSGKPACWESGDTALDLDAPSCDTASDCPAKPPRVLNGTCGDQAFTRLCIDPNEEEEGPTFSGKKYQCSNGLWKTKYPSESCSAKSSNCDYTCTTPICLKAISGAESCCNHTPDVDCEDGGLLDPITTGGGGGGLTTAAYCFVAGSLVTLEDRRQVKIEDVQIGEKLLDEKGNINTVEKLIINEYKGDIYSINGSGHFFTPNHPFKTLDGWKSLDPETTEKEIPDLKVDKMKLGDILIKDNGLEVVMTLDPKYTEEKVYNFQLDGTHEYIVNDFAVHNKLYCPNNYDFRWCTQGGSCVCQGKNSSGSYENVNGGCCGPTPSACSNPSSVVECNSLLWN